MPLRKQTGNMYGWIDATWNPIKGKCPHDCSYCYMKRWGEQPEIHLDEKELKTELIDPKTGKQGLFIFVGSSCDMWAATIPRRWQIQIMNRCEQYPENTYLFQSKNPWLLRTDFTIKGIYGTTVETNRNYPCMGKAPRVTDRINAMQYIRNHGHHDNN